MDYGYDYDVFERGINEGDVSLTTSGDDFGRGFTTSADLADFLLCAENHSVLAKAVRQYARDIRLKRTTPTRADWLYFARCWRESVFFIDLVEWRDVPDHALFVESVLCCMAQKVKVSE